MRKKVKPPPSLHLWAKSLPTPNFNQIWRIISEDTLAKRETLPSSVKVKVKVIPQQAEVAQGVPGRLRPRIFLTFGATRVVGRQPYEPAAFTPGEIPGTHFQRLSRPQGTWFRQGEPRKKIPSDTTENRSRDCPTSSAVPKPLRYPRQPSFFSMFIKGKGKDHPRTGHEGPKGEYRYSSTLSLTSALEGGCEINARPQPLYLRETPGTHCLGRWVGPGAGLDGCR